MKAEELGVEIYPGFAASEVLIGFGAHQCDVREFMLSLYFFTFQILYDSNDKVVGIATNDMGVAKDGSKKDIFQPGVELKGESYSVHIVTLFLFLSLFGGKRRSIAGSYSLINIQIISLFALFLNE